MKKLLSQISLISVLPLLFILLSPAAAADNSIEVTVQTDVNIPMRDGVNLLANIFLPKADGKFPVILTRTPYMKGNAKLDDGLFYARRDYVYVSQDCRGRCSSGDRCPPSGKWEPFVNEKNDGDDTRAWILKQPWCNGSIGTVGGSYVGFTQWICAPGADEHLKTMCTQCPVIDTYKDVAYDGGAFQLAIMMGWGTSTSPYAKWLWTDKHWLKAYKTLPLSSWDKAIGHELFYLRDWVAHPQFDSYWAARGVHDFNNITVPILAIGGWYDLFAKGVLDGINAVRTTSRSPVARANQYVIMGPWMHMLGPSKVGELDFGKDAAVDLRQFQTQWLDYRLKGQANGVDKWAPVRIFVMGKNQWRDEQTWPLQRTKYTPYYLHSKTPANSIRGQGRLSTAMPADEPADKFVYDSNDPVPTRGGPNLYGCSFGPLDQNSIEIRNDVLVFTTDVLKTDFEVTGPVKAVLYAASSAKDTDWTAKLVDVHPDGRAYNICEGIIRARCRQSAQHPTLIEPGKIYRYDIDLWVTSNVFLAGHKLRVEISSSNFPRFDRNPNTGEPFGTGPKLLKASQTIYHDADHPSHILLPVIP